MCSFASDAFFLSLPESNCSQKSKHGFANATEYSFETPNSSFRNAQPYYKCSQNRTKLAKQAMILAHKLRLANVTSVNFKLELTLTYCLKTLNNNEKKVK